MITNINRPIFSLAGQTNAIILETSDLNENRTIKVYVPRVMPNIEISSPKVSILQTNGYSIFKNTVNRPALTGRLIKEKNYLESSFNSDANINDMENTSYSIIKELNNTIDKLVSANELNGINTEDKKISYILKKDTQVRVEFLNNKVNRLAYSITDKSDYITELK